MLDHFPAHQKQSDRMGKLMTDPNLRKALIAIALTGTDSRHYGLVRRSRRAGRPDLGRWHGPGRHWTSRVDGPRFHGRANGCRHVALICAYSLGVAAHLNQFWYSMDPVCRSTLSRCTSELSTVTMSAVMVPSSALMSPTFSRLLSSDQAAR